MRIFSFFLIVLISNATCCFSGYVKNERIDDAYWNQAQSYLLPFDHPVRQKLDAIFHKTRATTSIKTFSKAGFQYLPLRKWDNIIVAFHPKLKGYVVKVYLDDQIGISNQLLMQRIDGANSIKDAIKAFKAEKLCKAPNKWIYPLPEYPEAVSGLHEKFFILVEEDLQLVSASSNFKKWKSKVTKPQIKAVFNILQTVGLTDSVYITNIPFSKDGKIAFIDTEHHHKWPIKFHRWMSFLSPEMGQYVVELINTNGQAE